MENLIEWGTSRLIACSSQRTSSVPSGTYGYYCGAITGNVCGGHGGKLLGGWLLHLGMLEKWNGLKLLKG